MPLHRLNLRNIESRMNQIVIDLHDAARRCDSTDPGVALALRILAHEQHDLVNGMRRLLVSDVDSGWSDLT